jgi:hypothetical protein
VHILRVDGGHYYTRTRAAPAATRTAPAASAS